MALVPRRDARDATSRHQSPAESPDSMQSIISSLVMPHSSGALETQHGHVFPVPHSPVFQSLHHVTATRLTKSARESALRASRRNARETVGIGGDGTGGEILNLGDAIIDRRAHSPVLRQDEFPTVTITVTWRGNRRLSSQFA